MSSRNYCSGSSRSLRNPCHTPVSSSIAFCTNSVNYGDAICLPSSCQGNPWILDNCHETYSEPTKDNCGEPAICQPASCERRTREASCCPPTAYCVSRPYQGTSFLPVPSVLSGSCLPVSCRPLSYVSSSYRPLSSQIYDSHSFGCVPMGYGPLNYLPNTCGPVNLLNYGYQPFGGLTCRPQALGVVPNSLRPARPLSSCCQPLTHVFNTCRPSGSALGNW
ncbi:keratin-associated protein 26-1 [Tenrec ecaudatus]|uniref:keratin-associated protein 26-1 n=1 Tax=Tenrec ecaudatus TaxID=94439 RepID=UPI003F591BFC